MDSGVVVFACVVVAVVIIGLVAALVALSYNAEKAQQESHALVATLVARHHAERDQLVRALIAKHGGEYATLTTIANQPDLEALRLEGLRTMAPEYRGDFGDLTDELTGEHIGPPVGLG